jgi:hypothetical protein
MKNFALLDDNNKVLNISIADESWIGEGWVEYTNDNPAYINGDYVDGYFYAPQPYPSWTRNNGQWLPPTPAPNSSPYTYWDEPTLTWIQHTQL